MTQPRKEQLSKLITGTPDPANVGDSPASGSSGFASPADHTHAHGVHSDPSLHQVADSSSAGFMSSAQASQLASGTKGSVKVGTTANITLSGIQTIDGVSVVAGDRVLVKDQSTSSQNGIYVVANASWSRATDFNTSNQAGPGALVFVEQGTVNAGSIWFLSTISPITLGSTSLAFNKLTNSYTTIASLVAAVTPLFFNDVYVEETCSFYTFVAGDSTTADSWTILQPTSGTAGRWKHLGTDLFLTAINGTSDDWPRLIAALNAAAAQGKRLVLRSGNTWVCNTAPGSGSLSGIYVASNSKLLAQSDVVIKSTLTATGGPGGFAKSLFYAIATTQSQTAVLHGSTTVGIRSFDVDMSVGTFAANDWIQISDSNVTNVVEIHKIISAVIVSGNRYTITIEDPIQLVFDSSTSTVQKVTPPENIDLDFSNCDVSGTGDRIVEFGATMRSKVRNLRVTRKYGSPHWGGSFDIGGRYNLFENCSFDGGGTADGAGWGIENNYGSKILNCAAKNLATTNSVCFYLPDCYSCELSGGIGVGAFYGVYLGPAGQHDATGSINCKIHDVTITDGQTNGAGLIVNDGSNLSFENIVVQRCYYGVMLSPSIAAGPQNVTLNNIVIANTTSDALIVNTSTAIVSNIFSSESGGYHIHSIDNSARLNIHGLTISQTSAGTGPWEIANNSKVFIDGFQTTGAFNGAWAGITTDAGEVRLINGEITLSGTGTKTILDMQGVSAATLYIEDVNSVTGGTFGVYAAHANGAIVWRGNNVDLSSTAAPWSSDAQTVFYDGNWQNVQLASNASAPFIFQKTAASGAGQDLTVKAQSAATTLVAAGKLILAGGSGKISGTDLAGDTVVDLGTLVGSNSAKLQFKRSGSNQGSIGFTTNGLEFATSVNYMFNITGTARISSSGAQTVDSSSTLTLKHTAQIFADTSSNEAFRITPHDGTAPTVLQFATAVSQPKFFQADRTTNSGTGETLTIQAQNETGTSSNGGPLVLASGTGTTAAGNLSLKVGSATKILLTATDNTIGDGSVSSGSLFLDAGASAIVRIRFNGGTYGTFSTSTFDLNESLTMTGGNILFNSALAAPTVKQNTQTTDVATNDLTITSQAAFASATGTNRTGGNIILQLADPTNSGTGLALVKVKTGSTSYIAFGKYDSASNYGGYWAGNPTPSGSNFVFLGDATTATYLNCPSAGTIFLAFDGTAANGLALTTTTLILANNQAWTFKVGDKGSAGAGALFSIYAQKGNGANLGGILKIGGGASGDGSTKAGALQFDLGAAITNVSAKATFLSGINLVSVRQNGATIADISGETTELRLSILDQAFLRMTGTGMAFFGTAAIAQPTGVAVTAAGIHAALVSLGLITA